MLDPKEYTYEEWVNSLSSDECLQLFFDSLDPDRMSEILQDEYKKGRG